MTEEYIVTDVVCRCMCCLNENNLENIWEKHELDGEEEIYGIMLKECFDISWQLSSFQEMICEMCVSRLREAVYFKKQILASQEALKEDVAAGGVIDFETKIKIEEDEATGGTSMVYEQVEYLEPEYTVEEVASLSEVASSSQVSTPEPRKLKWPKKKIKSERNKTYKQYSRSDLKAAVELIRAGKITCADAAEKYGIPKNTLNLNVNNKGTNQGDETKEANSEKHYKLIEEIKILLTLTNAILFRTKTSRYYCFYCTTDGPIFEDPDDLRKHTHTVHFKEKTSSLEQLMKPQWMHEVIKLDVEELVCTDCDILLTDWNKMFEHFAEVHRVEFNEAYTRVIPYALTSDLQCILCHDRFHNFGHLDSHMNNHYSNYICYECGDTFLAASRLDKHLNIHKVGCYPCTACEKVFSLEKYRSKHFNLVHNPESVYKCLYCPERFIGVMQRHVHVTEKHKEKVKTFTCEVCGKCFTWKPYFLAHMRKRHNGEKKYQCTYCPKAFLMQYELKNHVTIHTGDKHFVCGVCMESFRSMNTLRKHIKRHLVKDDSDN